MILHRQLNKEQFLDLFFNFLMIFLPPITEQQRKILHFFLNLPLEHEFLRFSLPKKKLALTHFKITPASLGNHLYALIDAGYLERTEDNIIVLKPSIAKMLKTFDAGRFSFTLNVDNDNRPANTTDS